MSKFHRGGPANPLSAHTIAVNPQQFFDAFERGASTDAIQPTTSAFPRPGTFSEPTFPGPFTDSFASTVSAFPKPGTVSEPTFPGPSTDLFATTVSAFPKPGTISEPTFPGPSSDAFATSDFTIQTVVNSFSAGTLSSFGDALSNTITISRDAAGKILVNAGTSPISGGTPTVANTSLIQVLGQGGDDVIALNESNGALPRANLFGGTGNDTLTGGSSGDMLFGQAGNDVLLGKGGADFLFGGSENDTLTGGDANDQMFGEAGDDRMIWNQGDDSDLMEGGAGNDTADVNGGTGAEHFTVTANGTRVRFDRLDPAPFALDIGTTENLVVKMNGGDDTFSATGNLAALIQITVDGGAGNDTILGSNGADVLLGGDGNDFIDGQQGNDVALLGAGNDVFQWDPGDGSDTVEGQAGNDRLLFNGSAGSEVFTAAANGGRVLFTRNLANIVMDLNDVETLELNALGNTDSIIVNDLSGTDITTVKVNLAGTFNGTAGDAAVDVVATNGTNGNNTIDVIGSGTSISVLGLPAAVHVSNSEGANDSVIVNGLGGNDSLVATSLAAGIAKLTLDGGEGNDTLLGSQGADVLIGGAGNDFALGDNGNDLALLGAGDDVFQWNPGDGNDTIEGQDGTDSMLFFGANVTENVSIFANGGRALFTRDVASVTMDLNDVERIDYRALGGADNIVIGDLSGTDVTNVSIDLRGPTSGGDGAADTITVNATSGSDVFGVTGDAGGVAVFGLQAGVSIFQQEVANDRLVLNGLGGDDVIDASSLEAGGIQLTMNGGLGNDFLIGSEGGDLLNGGDGNDVALMGAGDDTFVWNPGDDNDALEGQTGFDALSFNGANVAENITLSASEGRAIFFRNVANVMMDMDDVEQINFSALGGADNVVINDMSGTDVQEINVSLAGFGNAGDAAADTVTMHASNNAEIIQIFGDAAGVGVRGLASRVNITGAEAANDRLVINGFAGDDFIDASAVDAGAMQLTLDGGAGNDVIIGGEGNDILIGGDGNDLLIGGGGTDIFIAGNGDDIEIQSFVSGSGDVLDLRAFDVSFESLMARASSIGGDVVFDMGEHDITLQDVSLSSLQEQDFLLA